MNAFYILLAASPVLLLCAVAFLVVIVVGIRKGDRGDLASPPRTCIDAVTRRVLGVSASIRSNDDEGDR
jgi:hypothetical protein